MGNQIHSDNIEEEQQKYSNVSLIAFALLMVTLTFLICSTIGFFAIYSLYLINNM
jgi:hypothetical protein